MPKSDIVLQSYVVNSKSATSLLREVICLRVIKELHCEVVKSKTGASVLCPGFSFMVGQ